MAAMSADILEVPVESVCVIEPVLSSTNETQSLVWPHTTVDDEATLTVLMPATFMSTVGIGTVVETVTDWPLVLTVTAAGVP